MTLLAEFLDGTPINPDYGVYAAIGVIVLLGILYKLGYRGDRIRRMPDPAETEQSKN